MSDPITLFAEWLSMYMADAGLTESSPDDEIAAYIERQTRAEWQDELDHRSAVPDSAEQLLDAFCSVDAAVTHFKSLGIRPEAY